MSRRQEDAAVITSTEADGFVASDEQRQAIEHGCGPMLVVAGAGTGKTAVLSRRIAHLITSGLARPDEILAVTYTRNAAAQLVTRTAALLYEEPGQQHSLFSELDRTRVARKLLSSGLQAETFHSYCFARLGEAGIKFELLDDKDLQVLLRRRIGELKLEHFIKAADPGKFLKDLMDFFRRCHDELRTPKDYDNYLAQVERGKIALPRVGNSKDAEAMPHAEVMGRCREIARAFHYMEDLLQQEGLGSFGHIITRAVDLLGRRQAVLQRAQRRARFILIDEFQDSNVAQIRLAKLLAGDEANVFAVGDPDQAIYRFRGATSGAFDQFLKTFGADRVRRVTMAANRRSTSPILRCAYQAIKCNPEVGSVELGEQGWPREPLSYARREREGQPAEPLAVQAILHGGEEHEAAFVAETIEKMRQQRPAMKLGDIAVLYRNHHHREELVPELHRRGIPVRVRGADLFGTPELRDAMAVLKIMSSPDPIALFRVAALPQFEVEAEGFRAELVLAGENPPVEALLEKVPGGLAVMERVREARHDVAIAVGKLGPAMEIAQRVFQLGDSKPLQRFQEFAERWSKKSKQISGEGTLREFLEYVDLFCEYGGALVEDPEEDDPAMALAPLDLSRETGDAVELMTVHAAKGLEFPCVFLLRVSSGSFPNHYRESLVEFPQELRSKDTAAEGEPKKLCEEEERRLFYVGVTRAMDELYICGKRSAKKGEPAPSKYMRELLSEARRELAGAVECREATTRIDLIHAAAEALPRVSEWVQLEPRVDARLNELSASAVEQYERCPLAYKLKRDWQLPEEAAAALQYGSAMHLALKAYFDGVRAGRPPDEETRDCLLPGRIFQGEDRGRAAAAAYEKRWRRSAHATAAF